MAEVTVKKCDVFDVIKEVEAVSITVTRSNSATGNVETDTKTVDMCPAAFKRLNKFVDRAVAPPNMAKAE